MRPRDKLVELIPGEGQRFFLERESGAKEFRLNPLLGWSLDSPVVGVGLLTGLEYARWLTGKHQGRWRFRLPTDFEWEKAARGIDRRRFIWGNYLVHSFMNSRPGSYRMAFERVNDLAAAGTYPLDESIYGVRDLAGSAKEPVLTHEAAKLPPPLGRFSTLRGGSWDDTDHRDFHAATRNRRPPERGYYFTGIRLAADLPGE
jgi:formylglycine-generating enzyme required for sulfatase activity